MSSPSAPHPLPSVRPVPPGRGYPLGEAGRFVCSFRSSFCSERRHRLPGAEGSSRVPHFNAPKWPARPARIGETPAILLDPPPRGARCKKCAAAEDYSHSLSLSLSPAPRFPYSHRSSSISQTLNPYPRATRSGGGRGGVLLIIGPRAGRESRHYRPRETEENTVNRRASALVNYLGRHRANDDSHCVRLISRGEGGRGRGEGDKEFIILPV